MRMYSKSILGFILVLFFISLEINAQHTDKSYDEFSPAYILISTLHWNEDINYAEWKEVEQKFFENVTSKNEYILGSGVYRHLISPDDSEIIFVTVYSSLRNIEEGSNVTKELIEKAWPDEEQRKSFIEKQSSFYTGVHSDEIVTSLPFQKDLVTDLDGPLIYYVRKNKLGKGGSGYKEFFENIIMKNEYIRGYYTHKHRYGPNSTDATEIAIFNSLADFETAFVENDRLVNEYWLNEDDRKEFFKEFKKIFAGHGDYLYQNIPELAK